MFCIILFHHVINLLLLLYINSNEKILSYSVKHFQTFVKFSYCEFTSPYTLSLYIAVKYEN